MRRARRRARLAPIVCLCGLSGAVALAAGGALSAIAALSASAAPAAPGAIAVPAETAVSAAAAPGGPAATEPSASLHVTFAPDRPGARTTIELSLRVTGPEGLAPPPLRSFALRLPAGMGIATTTLGEANCQAAELMARGLDGCPLDARLGYGSASASVSYGPHTIVEHAALHPLMGPAAENRLEVLFYLEARAPVFAQLVLPATLTEDMPPFGERLETAVPLVEAWPEGPDLALQTFSSTLGPKHLVYDRHSGGRTVAYHPRGVRIPSACPNGGYPFVALLRFADGSSATTSYRVPCSRD